MTSTQVRKAWRAVGVLQKNIVFVVLAFWFLVGTVTLVTMGCAVVNCEMLQGVRTPSGIHMIFGAILDVLTAACLGWHFRRNLFLWLGVNPELLESPKNPTRSGGQSSARAAAQAFINHRLG